MKPKKKNTGMILILIAVLILIMLPVFRNRDRTIVLSSNVQNQTITDQQTNSLYKLCKVWGFVKYRHPSVVAGDLSWDKELLPIMEQILTAENDEQANDMLAEWLTAYPIDYVQTPVDKESVELQDSLGMLSDDTQWIHDRNFLGKRLCSELENIGAYTISDRKFAYGSFPTAAVDMKNEDNWEFDIQDTGIRMLSLFRFWNAIEYFSPGVNLIATDWDQVLLDAIPQMASAKSYDDYILTLARAGAELGDGQLVFQTAQPNKLQHFFGDKRLPCFVRRVDNQLVVWQTGNVDSTFLPGDILVAIDGVTLEDRINQLLPFASASGENQNLNQIQARLLEIQGETSQVTIIRDGKELTIQVSAVPYLEMNNPFKNGLLPGTNIGYIDPSVLQGRDLKHLMDKFSNTDGIIVDLRKYPSIPIAYELAESIKPKPKQFVSMAYPNPGLPGSYYRVDSLCSGRGWMKDMKITNDEYMVYSGKIVLLMDEQTQGMGELAVMSLRQAPNAIVIGSTSAGACGITAPLRLPDVKGGKLRVQFTCTGIYTTDGEPVQQNGLDPDIGCTPTVESIKEGRDELVDRAIQYIETGK